MTLLPVSLEPPNGGFLAWSQVLASFFFTTCSMGFVTSFGVFQFHYEHQLLSSQSPSTIAWIGTIQGALVNGVGVISGRLYDLGYVRSLVYTGAMLNVGGILAASFATTYATTVLSLGLCVGLGSGIFYVPAQAVITSYFTTKIPLATGIGAAGTCAGGILYPILFHVLVDRVGFAWTCRTFALINFVLLLASCLALRPRVRPSLKRQLFDATAFHDINFLLFSTALFLLWAGVDIPFYFLPSLVKERLGPSEQIGDYLIAVLNGSSLFSRPFAGLVAVYFGTLRVWQTSIWACTVLLACWASIGNLPGIVCFVVLYGFFIGAAMSLVAPVLLVISPDQSLVGTRLGMSSLFAGVGFLIGPPVAGAIQVSPLRFSGQALFAGVTYLCAFAITLWVGWLHRTQLAATLAKSVEVKVEWPKAREALEEDRKYLRHVNTDES